MLLKHTATIDNSTPLLDQPAVQMKMKKFHAELASLEIPRPCDTCTCTCLEVLPGVPVRSESYECKRCRNDSYSPKLYPTANTMDPGSVPSQLQACMYVYV